MTKHQKEILYKKLYNEKVQELKKDSVTAVMLSVCNLLMSVCCMNLIVRELQRDDFKANLLILSVFCFVACILCFIFYAFNIVYYRKIIPNQIAEYINSGFCSINLKQESNGQQYFCVDMGVYFQKVIPLENIGEYIENFKTEKRRSKQCQN